MNSSRTGTTKKAYRTPELTVYGPIGDLTQTRPAGTGQRDNPVNMNKT